MASYLLFAVLEIELSGVKEPARITKKKEFEKSRNHARKDTAASGKV